MKKIDWLSDRYMYEERMHGMYEERKIKINEFNILKINKVTQK